VAEEQTGVQRCETAKEKGEEEEEEEEEKEEEIVAYC
jgi:hypothetical protein